MPLIHAVEAVYDTENYCDAKYSPDNSLETTNLDSQSIQSMIPSLHGNLTNNENYNDVESVSRVKENELQRYIHFINLDFIDIEIFFIAFPQF